MDQGNLACCGAAFLFILFALIAVTNETRKRAQQTKQRRQQEINAGVSRALANQQRPPKVEPYQPPPRHCQRCKLPLRPGSHYCGNCGQKNSEPVRDDVNDGQ